MQVFQAFLKVTFNVLCISLCLCVLIRWPWQLYIALIFVIVVCSLGNRPQGSKWIYAFCMVLFGLCNILTLWCAGYTVYLAVPHSVTGWEHLPE